MFTLYNRLPSTQCIETILDNFWSSYHSPFAAEEEDGAYLFNIELPGFDRSQIKIISKDNTLEVRASDDKDKKREKSITLPADADPSKTEAKLKNGILRIKIPKQESAKSKEIKIN